MKSPFNDLDRKSHTKSHTFINGKDPETITESGFFYGMVTGSSLITYSPPVD